MSSLSEDIDDIIFCFFTVVLSTASLSTCISDIITCWLDDLNFINNIFVLKTIFFSLSVLVCRILLLPLENKTHIFVPPCNIFYQWTILQLSAQ